MTNENRRTRPYRVGGPIANVPAFALLACLLLLGAPAVARLLGLY